MAIQNPQQGIINNMVSPPPPMDEQPPADQYKALKVKSITTQADDPTVAASGIWLAMGIIE